MAGVIIDRFGQDVTLFPAEDDTFTVRVSMVVSPLFFSWLSGFGTDIRMIAPADVVEEYRTYLTEILEGYEGV